MSLRKMTMGGSVAMFVFALMAVGSVAMGSFWLYCGAKLLLSAAFGLLDTVGYTLPKTAEDKEVRQFAGGGKKRTSTSAAAVGTVLGGYAAQALGNAWVYVLVALATIPVYLIALNLMSKEVMAPGRSEVKPGKSLDFVRHQPAIWIILLIMVPTAVATGYTSILFPLFSADLGLTKAQINNISVIGQLIVCLWIPDIEYAQNNHGKWSTATFATIAMGCVFLLFSFKTTIMWSIAVVVLVAVLKKTSSGWKSMWLRAAKDQDLPTGQAIGAMFATNSVISIVRSSLLAALVGAASSVAVLILGAICLVCGSAFYVITRKSSLRSV